ncbi:uncharacterized protein LOC113278933 [Papaver somniferum]|uniref:uncharacterized protein LOC113278933 n=1 Tax=Papaver somniferum TaxID=3469 RepID=UPI000E6FF496|nr:uncharacterized protein LOC113278933 [Papaver somniferum]
MRGLNDPHKQAEVGGAPVSPSQTSDFQDCIHEACLLDLPFSGCFITWWNQQQGSCRIGSKLDRVMVNLEWLHHFESSKADFLTQGISDHSPAIASIFKKLLHGPPPFRFYNFVTEDPDFMEIVREAWQHKVVGNPMFVLVSKMKRVKHILIKWKKEKFQHLSVKTLEAKKEMQCAQENVQKATFCHVFAKIEREAVSKYSTLAKYEESMLKQKSMVQWLDLSDSNTSFFHNSLKERKSRNNILTLTSNSGEKLDEDIPIAKEYTANELVRDVIRGEIVFALSTIGSIKAPGPYRFSSYFFKACWSIFGDDFVAAIKNFFSKSKLLKEVNSIFLTLVSKYANPSVVTDFRHIACCNVIYKCITKILYLRMKKIMKVLISSNQSAFVSERAIQDNILVSHELVRNCHRSNGTPRCVVKIDLKKAYDIVNWIVVILDLRKMVSLRGSFNGFIFVFLLQSTLSLLMDLHMDFLVLVEASDKAVLSLPTCNLASFMVLKSCLDNFSSCSGMEINKQKSSIYSSAIDPHTLDQMVACLDCSMDTLPVKYLVSEYIDNASWHLPSAYTDLAQQVVSEIATAEFNPAEADVVIWRPNSHEVFSIKDTYKTISTHNDPVNWHSLVWFKNYIPRKSFITWVAFHGRLKTRAKLKQWGLIENPSCVLCDGGDETEEHLFHDCMFASIIWKGLLLKLGYDRVACSTWKDELTWCIEHFAGSNLIITIKKLVFTGFFYELWRERNNMIFSGKKCTTLQVSLMIVQDIQLKLSAHPRDLNDNSSHRRFMHNWNINCCFTAKVALPCTWIRPEGDVIMVNTDGSKTDLSGGSGVILRDKNGDVIGCQIGGSSPISVPAHELQGVELGLMLAAFHNCQDIHGCLDSMTIYMLLKSENPKPPWNMMHIWRRVQDLLRKFKTVKFDHCFRETNRAADFLASKHPNQRFVR